MKIRKRFGTWNVRTLAETSKLAQLEREFARLNLLFVGLSEVRWNGCGEHKTASGATLIYSGKTIGERRESGVGFLLSKEAKQALIEWQPHGDRIILAKFKTRARTLTCVQCYAPTEVSDPNIKENFYDSLYSVLSSCPQGEIKLVMGDFNAQIGSDNNGKEQVMGKHALGTMNDNGERFYELCNTMGLTIGGSLFPHKHLHKITWISPDHVTENQIDHIAISKMWRHSLCDVRNKRSADMGTDHHLLIGELQLKLSAVNRKPHIKRKRFDLSKLDNPNVLNNYQSLLSAQIRNCARPEDEVFDAETYWEQAKHAFTEAAQQSVGNPQRQNDPWITERTWNLINARKEEKEKVNRARTRQTKQQAQANYSIANRRVKRSARADKRRWLDNLATEAQKASETHRLKDLHKITKAMVGRVHRNAKPIKNTRGELVYSTDEQLKIWEDHYRKLLAGNNTNPPQDLCNRHDEHAPFNEADTEVPNIAEIEEAINQLKAGKSAGPDNIAPELLKADKTSAAQILQPIVSNFWSTESLPSNLKDGIIINLPKKGSLVECSNWRGITLLNVAYKTIAQILHNRIASTVEPRLRAEQAGFRPNRSCADHINSLRIIVEQSSEWRSPLYLLFIDFKRAFDTLHHNAMWIALECKGIPNKLINLVKGLYSDAHCSVLHDGCLSGQIQIRSGVRQGCILSPLLFNIVLDVVMSEAMNADHGISFGLQNKLTDLDYADDICLLSHNFSQTQEMLNNIAKRALSAGLAININKTKSMRSNTNCSTNFQLDGIYIEDVPSFCYLGSYISNNGGSQQDIQHRLSKAKQAFGTLGKIWRSSNISQRTKIRLYNTNVKSILLYGCESWYLSASDAQHLQAFANRCLRRILRVFWPATITNSELWFRTNQPPISEEIMSRKYRWLGHTLRKPADDIARKVLDFNPQGSRRPGRPRNTWKRQTETELRNAGKSWSETKRLALNRVQWKLFVTALCST